MSIMNLAELLVWREFEDAMALAYDAPTDLPAFLAGLDFTWAAFNARREVGPGNMRQFKLGMLDKADMMLHFASLDGLWGGSTLDRINRSAMASAGAHILRTIAHAPDHEPLLEVFER